MFTTKMRVAAAVGLAAGAVMASSMSASAASWSTGNYGSLAHEGAYPGGNHACGGSGWSQPVGAKSISYHGRTVTIRLCYNGSVGAYARLDGAAVNDSRCRPILDRSNGAHSTSAWASVYKSVDGGVGYAYTKVGNDLNGRLARAAVWCDGAPVVRTAWY